MPWQRIQYRRPTPAWIIFGRLALGLLVVVVFVVTVWRVSR
jgi:hypothetical protein